MPPKRKATKTKQAAVTLQNTNTDFSKLKVNELKDECIARNLDNSGKKADLIKRLQEYESGEAGPSKKIKKEEEDGKPDEELSVKEKLKKMAEEEKKNKKKTFQVDSHCPRYQSGKIYEDFDCMLNQTNIGANNNKFYVIQMIDDGGESYYVWNRWGRVGESGQSALKGPFIDIEKAKSEFMKKFKDKTKNNWDNRDNFKPAAGKYTLIEMDAQDDTDNIEMEEKLAQLDSVDGSPVKQKTQTQPCKLDVPTQNLMKLIFDNDMFKEAMAELNLDVKKMPLGKISKSQIAKGFEVLEECEEALKLKNHHKKMQELTSRFYTLIPHNFGRQRPPIISTQEILRKKMDMLSVLGDIEIAQSLQKVDVKQEQQDIPPHPLDVNYGLLNCGLKHVPSNTDVHKIISTYVKNTSSSGDHLKLIDVWEVDRQGEDERFEAHKDISERKLLWHGTNVAVVVAILKSGLRIMPHSGGRVGRGIYFASEQSKSMCYVGWSGDGTGIMFLNEVALGNSKIIRRDDSSLTKAPAGFDSVLAQGRQEPDPAKDTSITIEGNEIVVPQGKPIQTKEANNSSFYNSEYLVYKESQCRIRYLLRFKIPH